MATELDHIVVGTKDLNSGAQWMEDMLGVPAQGGGEHATMGTHNRLWSLGPCYLELVAINPNAPAPPRPRWFGLDDPDIQDSLASGPRLLNWAVRVDDIEGIAKESPVNLGTIHTMSRGDFSWKVAIREDGALIHQGHVPLVIEWQTAHPASTMSDQDLSLVRMKAHRSEKTGVIKALESIGAQDLIKITDGSVTAGIMAEITTDDGNVSLVG
jgi:hypothetical protein